ncbi:hypothetical protein BH09MYX1_BH09MYX1_22320 [soil metagenome]
MSIESDRRAPGATRVPFEGLVEIGTSLGPAFEAQAVDVSQDGMHVRTACLPDVGQPLTCRFDAGAKGSVAATGEVIWRDEEEGDGGTFGLRFTDLDEQSEETLNRLVETGGAAAQANASGRVRLHIEGLGVAMKARVRDATRTKLTVGNDLGFLQLGKSLELEDVESGEKRPASIDRVELEVDPATRIPRLVVGLRYDDEVPSEAPGAIAAKDATPGPAMMDAAAATDEDVSFDEESEKMKSAFARNAAKVTPAILAIAKRANITAAMLWAKRGGSTEDASPPRRMTAPPPGGALHASGRKVVRDEGSSLSALPLKLKLDNKRKAALGASVGLAAVIAIAAISHKSAPPPQAHVDHVATQAAVDPMLANVPPPPALTSPTQPIYMDLPAVITPVKPGHVTPFGNGAVTHGNILHLKMDGAIEKINGASQPNGFSISIPNHKSLEPAGPLAARDARIASIKVSNDQAGAELDVAFKDGVPNYVVRAKGDTLEIVLAPPGTIAQAKAGLPKSGAPQSPTTAKKKPAAPPAPPAPHKK